METEFDGFHPLIPTKITAPQVEKTLVRHRLLSFLTPPDKRVVLVSAAAGSGKTTVFADYVRRECIPHSWLSLDEYDNEIPTFLLYLAASLNAASRELGNHALSLLKRSEVEGDKVVASLLRDLQTHAAALTLIVDDYHYITNKDLHKLFSRLIYYSPPHIRFVVLGRTYPPLTLGRLRAEGALLELRSEHLSLSPEETERLLRQSATVDLSAEVVEAIQSRTEGWAAGVRLAALMLNQNAQVEAWINAMQHGQSQVMRYIGEQIFDLQPPEVQDFLLTTCVLKRFSAPICNRLLNIPNAADYLHDLDEQNLFLVTLDQGWYRYHHLFGDFLYERLKRRPDRVKRLLAEAAVCFEAEGLVTEAAQYALAAQDTDFLVSLILRYAQQLTIQHGQWALVEGWLSHLDESIWRAHPRLLLLKASIAGQYWRFDVAQEYLTLAKPLIESADLAEKPMLEAEFAAIEMLLPVSPANSLERLTLMADSLPLIRQHHPSFMHSFVTMRYADVCYMAGRYEEAEQCYWQAIEALQNQPNANVVLNSFGSLAIMARNGGNLNKALAICDQSMEYIRQWGLEASLEADIVYFRLTNLNYDQGNLDKALEIAAKLILMEDNLPFIMGGYLIMAKSYYLQGKTQDALDAMEFTLQLSGRQKSPLIHSIAERANLLLNIRMGNTQFLHSWLSTRAQGLLTQALNGKLSSSGELDFLMGIRAFLALGNTEEAFTYIAALEPQLDPAYRRVALLTLKALHAVAYEQSGQPHKADACLHDALTLIYRTGFVMPMAEIGLPLVPILKRYQSADEALNAYALRILTYAEMPLESLESRSLLTLRECEILRLVAIGCSNDEISQQLVLSLSTVKTHLRNIFSKLDTVNRTQAVAKARTLNILYPS